MADKTYRQVSLQCGSSELVAWIDGRLAVQGKIVKLEESDDNRHWTVKAVYGAKDMSAQDAAELRHRHTKWRETTDI